MRPFLNATRPSVSIANELRSVPEELGRVGMHTIQGDTSEIRQPPAVLDAAAGSTRSSASGRLDTIGVSGIDVF